jgi:undecaprenyl-diphosphatase
MNRSTRGNIVLSVLREAALRFRQGRSTAGEVVWRRWVRRIAVGFLGMIALMVALRYGAAWALGRGLLDWEPAFLMWLGFDAPLSFSTAVFLQTPGSDPTLFILVALTAGMAAWARRPIVCLSILLAAIVPDIVGRFGWLIWSRGRPDLLYEGIASPGFHSFPSGHTSKTVAVYGLLALLWIRASGSLLEKALAVLLLIVIVTAVPLGRMAMGVHWPSDVMGGMVIGAAWLAVLDSPDLVSGFGPGRS